MMMLLFNAIHTQANKLASSRFVNMEAQGKGLELLAGSSTRYVCIKDMSRTRAILTLYITTFTLPLHRIGFNGMGGATEALSAASSSAPNCHVPGKVYLQSSAVVLVIE